MLRLLLAAMLVFLCAPRADAQDVIRRTETTEIYRERGSIVETRTELVTVFREYVTYLRRVYSEIGITEEVIVRLIRIDVQILVSYIRFDFERVHVLVREQVEILGPVRARHVITFVERHPPPAVLPVYARPVWTQVTAVREDRVVLDLPRERIRTAVQRADIEPQKVEKAIERIDLRTGKLPAEAAQILGGETDPVTREGPPEKGRGKAPPAATPEAGAPGRAPDGTPAGPERGAEPEGTPESKNIPGTKDAPESARPGEEPPAERTPGEAAETPRTGQLPGRDDLPGRDEIPGRDEVPGRPSLPGAGPGRQPGIGTVPDEGEPQGSSRRPAPSSEMLRPDDPLPGRGREGTGEGPLVPAPGSGRGEPRLRGPGQPAGPGGASPGGTSGGLRPEPGAGPGGAPPAGLTGRPMERGPSPGSPAGGPAGGPMPERRMQGAQPPAAGPDSPGGGPPPSGPQRGAPGQPPGKERGPGA